MKFRKPFKGAARARAALSFAAIAAVFCALLFFPRGQTAGAEERTIVEVWNVDTFEGGTGSRTAFLGRAARAAEKRLGNVYYYVTSYSADGFRAALAKGDVPDALSFGVGLGDISKLCLPLDQAFAGGETAEGCLAVPWCAGGYVLYSADGDFSAAGETAISCGGNNLPCVAAALAGIGGAEMGSEEAYVGFLSGKYRYLLGTQRDRCRFRARNVSVGERPLDGFCDLYQYFAVFSEEKRAACNALLGALLSEETQEALGEIGMRPPREEGGKWTVSVFTPPETLAEIAEAARRGDAANFPDKYLKKV